MLLISTQAARSALGLIPTAIAYTLGIMGIARLCPRFASQVGLSEAMFAVLTAWLLPGEAITVSQAVGGAVVLLRLALARQGDRTEKVGDEPLAGRASPSVAMWPEMEELQTGQTAVRR